MFAWIGPESGPSGTYLDAFDNLPDADKADALVQIAFGPMENIFMWKSWWDELSAKHRVDLTHRIRSGVRMTVRAPDYYMRNTPLLAEAGLIEEVRE